MSRLFALYKFAPRQYAQNRESEYLFVNPDTGGPYLDLKKGFAEACRRAGIRDLRWHDLRHTFGTRLAEAGHSEATIAELMGHSNPKTTRRYTHATNRAKRAAVEAASNRAQEGGEQWGNLKVAAG